MDVETITDPSALEGPALENLIQKVDLVCVTDYDRDSLVSLVLFFVQQTPFHRPMADSHQRSMSALQKTLLRRGFLWLLRLHILRLVGTRISLTVSVSDRNVVRRSSRPFWLSQRSYGT